LIAALVLARRPSGLIVVLCGLTTIAVGIAYGKLPAITPTNMGLRTEVAASYLLLSAGYALVRHEYRFRVPPFLPLLTFAMAVVCYFDFAPWWVRLIASPMLLAFTVNHLGDVYPWVKRMLDHRLLRWFGVCSYSIYLWQQPFYRSADSLPGTSATAFVLAILAGAMSFYFLEDPARRWINERYGQRRPVIDTRASQAAATEVAPTQASIAELPVL
jgi:peptidoglycan/LPS O-acetylase OafA/YrhL